MFKKIISIKNVGRFQNCAAAGDVELRRCNLVFAENGRGKSTLCAILRSLQSGDPTHIIGRRTLGSPDAPEVKLLFNDGPTTFRNDAWGRTKPNLAVFDNTFVTENIYSGETVVTEHRRNLYRVIIGSQGVMLARKLEQLDTDIRDKNRDIRTQENELRPNIPPGMSITDFFALTADSDIAAKISAKERELEAVKQAEDIQQRPMLSPLVFPSLPSELTKLLGKTIEGVAGDAEEQVAEHIRSHDMGDVGETWLSSGLGYINNQSCPFCGQDVNGVELLDVYRAFFSAAYHELKEEITALIASISCNFGDREIGRMMETVEANKAGFDFWARYCAIPALSFDKRVISDAIVNLRTETLRLLRLKAAAPLEPVIMDESFRKALDDFESAKIALAAYNAIIGQANEHIRDKKATTDVTRHRLIEQELLRLKAIKARHNPEVRSICQALQDFQKEKADLENEKAQIRNGLDQYIDQVVGSYEQSINRYLDRFNAGFRITRPEHSYRGGTPSSTYRIIINGTPVSIGDATTPLSDPSFKNTLSAGDKSTLALAFFLTQLEREPDPQEKIVIFDDPFTSQDSFRRNTTVHQIIRCGDRHAQVIVLSHDPWFLKLLWDRLQTPDRKTLQLGRVAEQNTTVAEWNIEEALKCRYQSDIEALSNFYNDGEGQDRVIVQKIRPILERYCRNLCPNRFTDEHTLGVIVGLIRKADIDHPLYQIADDLDEVNAYCRRYHHGENPNAAIEAIDNAELNGYVRRTLTLVGCLH